MTNYSVLKKGKRYFYYKCTDSQCRNAVNAEKFDTAILEKVKAAPTDGTCINEALEIWKELRVEKIEAAEPIIKQLKDAMQIQGIILTKLML